MMNKMNDKELKQILSDHALWLEDPKKGERADLEDANLSGGMSKYNFTISGRKVDSIHSALDSEIVIEVTSASFCGTRMYLKFLLEYSSSKIIFQKVELKPSAGWSSDEHKGFLKGYFGFLEERQFLVAIEELKLKLNGQNLGNNLPLQWNEFMREFMVWYASDIDPLIRMELEIFNKYAKNTNN